jgi:hypothetical protein
MSAGTIRRGLRDHRREAHPSELTCAACAPLHEKLLALRRESRLMGRVIEPIRPEPPTARRDALARSFIEGSEATATKVVAEGLK